MQAIRTHFYEPVFSALYSTFEPIKNKVQDVVQAIFSEIRASYALCSNRTKITAAITLCGTLVFAACLPVSIALKVAFVASSIIAFSGAYYVGLRMNIDSAYGDVVKSQIQELEVMKNALIQATVDMTETNAKVKCSLDTYAKATYLLYGILGSLPNVRCSRDSMNNDPIFTEIDSYLRLVVQQIAVVQEVKTSLFYQIRRYPLLADNPTLENVQQTQRATQEHHQKIKTHYQTLLQLIRGLTENGRKTLTSVGF